MSSRSGLMECQCPTLKMSFWRLIKSLLPICSEILKDLAQGRVFLKMQVWLNLSVILLKRSLKFCKQMLLTKIWPNQIRVARKKTPSMTPKAISNTRLRTMDKTWLEALAASDLAQQAVPSVLLSTNETGVAFCARSWFLSLLFSLVSGFSLVPLNSNNRLQDPLALASIRTSNAC